MTWRTAIWSCGYDPISESELVGGGNVHRHPTKWMWSRSSTTRTRLPSQRFRRNWTMSLRDLDCCHGDKWCGCIGWPVNIVTENQKASLSHTDVPPSDTHSPMETGRYYASVVAKPDRKTQRNNTRRAIYKYTWVTVETASTLFASWNPPMLFLLLMADQYHNMGHTKTTCRRLEVNSTKFWNTPLLVEWKGFSLYATHWYYYPPRPEFLLKRRIAVQWKL